ncbi:IclR family transcriptional regulator [Blastococcus brunescens]|uniref:IclR family transcriptional regulator n=1 Tax=Blastococcus brunescens TaxID=1564165 RepID=A0ABZ1AUV7_9ACTN|nr:IclR family transcriptional regulator [Blastococcus sp. BMG 8361]WRL62285.1 IclR family transcriptional regulator [Blastococcus sp. BMG 8361]
MRVVATAFQVLEQVATHQPVGVSDLARSMGLPKSTIQRALVSLHEVGWVEQAPGGDRRWMVTTRLLVLASRAGGLDLREQAMPVMRELLAMTDENVHLAIRSGRDGVAIIEKLDSGKTVRLFDPLGVVAPIHASSSGKAILAWSDDSDIDQLLAESLERYTGRTVADGDALQEELRTIRKNGYAVNRGEWRDEVRGVAAPILDAQGRARAAISVAVPAARLPERRIPALGRLVADTVSRLSLSDGHVGETRAGA